jgi:hypothetical protein
LLQWLLLQPVSTWLAVRMATDNPSHQALRTALSNLRDAANDNLARTTEILERLDRFEVHLAAGDPVTDAVADEPTPRIVEMLSLNMAALQTRGADFRAAQARSLHEEGLTMEAIGDLFGVTRQRISALLR